MKQYYRQRLPHFQPIGAIFFITFRLADSIPYKTIVNLKENFRLQKKEIEKIQDKTIREKKLYYLKRSYFNKYEKLLHVYLHGPHWLSENLIAQIIADQLYKYDKKLYSLIAFTIMSNHVHIVLDTTIQLRNINPTSDDEIKNFVNLDKILKLIKGSSARFSNTELNREGQFWEKESFDVLVRNERMLQNVISYILHNPVKAGLVDKWEDYKWTYLKNS